MEESATTAASGQPEQSGQPGQPTKEQIRRWRRYLADEIAEGQIYQTLADRKDGEEREILLELAAAEKRHEEHWRQLLGPEHSAKPPRPSFHRTLLRWLAKIFGSVFVLALLQRSESDTPYAHDVDATRTMAADEAIHGEVVRGLAARGREKIAGNFRAAVFGANDGIVSNFALVLGIAATNVSPEIVIFTGFTGLLSGALSMAAGEYISVKSQREFVEASTPTQVTLDVAQHLDVDANELELVYKARGMSAEDARHRALERLGYLSCDCNPSFSARPDGSQGSEPLPNDELDGLGSAWGAAASSFLFFGSGALIPILPFLFGLTGGAGMIGAVIVSSIALFITGGSVGLLSAQSPLSRGFRQLFIGLAAAAVTYVVGSLIRF